MTDDDRDRLAEIEARLDRLEALIERLTADCTRETP